MILGAHVPFNSDLSLSLIHAVDAGMTACQFFLGSPQSFRRHRLSENTIQSCIDLQSRFPIKVFSHFPYVANLNGSKDKLAWNGCVIQDTKTTTIVKELQYELSMLARLGGGVVVHPGCYPDRMIGLKTIATTINKIEFSPNSTLLLENCAGEGSKLCKDLEEIKVVIDAVEPTKQPHVKVCIDTAHIWGQGDYDLRLVSEIDRLFNEIEATIGLEKLALIHLNDSEVELGSKKDRHKCIGTGYIWTKNTDSLKHLLLKCKDLKIPVVLETYESDVEIATQLIS